MKMDSIADMSSMTNTTFDPYTQTFTILLSNGLSPVSITMSDLDSFLEFNYAVVANFAIQFGASLVMLIVVLLITKDNKKKTIVFFLNVVALILSVIRAMLQILYWKGPFSEVYNFFSGDYSAVPRSAYNTSVALVVITFSLLISIELSLLLQVHILFKGLQNRLQMTLMLMASIIVALFAVGFRFGQTILNIETILDQTQSHHIFWIASGALILETISIWYFCIIFMGKLVFHIIRQRQMKATVFRPLQILSIMSGCTMIIPSIFAILEYFSDETFPEAGSLPLTIVAILLPLSSSWASSSVDGPAPLNFSSPAYNQKQEAYNDYTLQNGSAYDRKGSNGTSSVGILSHAEHVATSSRGMGSLGRVRGGGMRESDLFDDSLDGLEQGKIGISRTYSVRSGPASGGGFQAI